MVNNAGPAAHYTHRDEFTGDPDEVDALTCAICRAPVGLSSGDGEIPTGYVQYWAFWLDGDTDATVFCEDDFAWLADVAPAITAAFAAFTTGATP